MTEKMNIYQMYVQNGNKVGFFVKRNSWSQVAEIISIDGKSEGALKGSPPYFNNTKVIGRFGSGKLFEVASAGTYGYELISINPANVKSHDPLAHAIGIKQISLEELKLKLELPEGAEFCGYLVYVEDKDEFLASITETKLIVERAFVKSPEYAKRFDMFGDAHIASRIEKNEMVVGLFDLGKQFQIYPIN